MTERERGEEAARPAEAAQPGQAGAPGGSGAAAGPDPAPGSGPATGSGQAGPQAAAQSSGQPFVVRDKRRKPSPRPRPRDSAGEGTPPGQGAGSGPSEPAAAPPEHPAGAEAGTTGTATEAGAAGFAAELEGLRKELDERTADLQRITAEYANYRRRVERDRGLIAEQATAAVLIELLGVLDDLDRARAHGDLVGPFGAVAEQLISVLTKLGLTPFGEPGDPFDPTRHEAVAHSVSSEVTETTCVEVFRRGYTYGERLLRPALVAVAEPGEEPAGDRDAGAEVTDTGSPPEPDAGATDVAGGPEPGGARQTSGDDTASDGASRQETGEQPGTAPADQGGAAAPGPGDAAPEDRGGTSGSHA